MIWRTCEYQSKSLGTGIRKHTELLKNRKCKLQRPVGVSTSQWTRRRSETELASFGGHEGEASPPSRLMPMNGPVRAALQKVIDSRTTGTVFDYKHTGVSASTLRRGFEKACDRARIPFGLTVEGGVIWHDLRRTFATELRGRQVHEYDISDLLGHTIQSVTGTYARSTPEALEDAVNRLTEPRGSVIQFKRKAS